MNAYIEAQLDALGDPTRRAILRRLLEEPLAVGKLAEAFPVSRPAISQHLRVLERAGLTVHRSSGTRRVYAVNPAGFNALCEYFDQLWSNALVAFKNKVEEDSAKQKHTKRGRRKT